MGNLSFKSHVKDKFLRNTDNTHKNHPEEAITMIEKIIEETEKNKQVAQSVAIKNKIG